MPRRSGCNAWCVQSGLSAGGPWPHEPIAHPLSAQGVVKRTGRPVGSGAAEDSLRYGAATLALPLRRQLPVTAPPGRPTRVVPAPKAAPGKKGRAGTDSTAQSLAVLQVGPQHEWRHDIPTGMHPHGLAQPATTRDNLPGPAQQLADPPGCASSLGTSLPCSAWCSHARIVYGACVRCATLHMLTG